MNTVSFPFCEVTQLLPKVPPEKVALSLSSFTS